MDHRAFSVAGVDCFVGSAGIKKTGMKDMVVLLLAEGTQVAAVFTQNQFCAAPVQLSRELLQEGKAIRALVINRGNANAGMGEKGLKDAKAIAQEVEQVFALPPKSVLSFSTGVILEPLPVDKMKDALYQLENATWDQVAESIMTTDTVPKIYGEELVLAGKKVKIAAVAKGSGMIHPNMATLLSFMATDVKIERIFLQKIIKEISSRSFNCISIDGDTSTNDSFVLIATGTAGVEIKDEKSADYDLLKEALQRGALHLAKAIVQDGEGATKFICIKVKKARSVAEAKRVGFIIARSPLVKTAFFASDANLGRILCAIGNSAIENLDIHALRVWLGDILVVEKGGRALNYEEAQGIKVMAQKEITITVDLARGSEEATLYTCDLSYDYVKINAEYRT
jgi:glutamate N-acetyltransferase/amino-acid acetyltransferase